MRGGLWHLAAERLFVLEEVMLHLGAQEIFTAECDALIYHDFRRLFLHVQSNYRREGEDYLVVGPMTPQHASGAIMFVRGPSALRQLNRFLVEALNEDQEFLNNDVLLKMVNEMTLLAAFSVVHPHLIRFLPILPADYLPFLVTLLPSCLPS